MCSNYPPKASKATIKLPPARIEVESKFNPTPLSLSLLHLNSGVPPFRSLQRLSAISIRDEYYDTADKLLEASRIWLRKRNGAWEAKCRRGESSVHSGCVEVKERGGDGGGGVGEVVGRALEASGCGDLARRWAVQGGDECDVGNRMTSVVLEDALRLTAAFTTERKRWVADERYEIAIDETDFGHCVGEVEVMDGVVDGDMEMIENVVGREAADGGVDVCLGHDTLEKSRMNRLRLSLDAFMERYRWAFPVSIDDKVIGKLSAYHERFGIADAS